MSRRPGAARRGPLTFTDLRIEPDRLADKRGVPNFVIMEGAVPFAMIDQAENFLGLKPCVICGGRELTGKRYCLACDKSALDGKIMLPGLKIDQLPDPDWHAEATTYLPADLPGGVGPASGDDRPLRRRLRARKGRRRATG